MLRRRDVSPAPPGNRTTSPGLYSPWAIHYTDYAFGPTRKSRRSLTCKYKLNYTELGISNVLSTVPGSYIGRLLRVSSACVKRLGKVFKIPWSLSEKSILFSNPQAQSLPDTLPPLRNLHSTLPKILELRSISIASKASYYFAMSNITFKSVLLFKFYSPVWSFIRIVL